MECDGHKKSLIHDLDGTLLGKLCLDPPVCEFNCWLANICWSGYGNIWL